MIYTFLYMLFTAFSSALRGVVGSKIPVMLTIFLATLAAIIFFHLVNAKNIINTYRKITSLKKIYFITSLSVLVMWTGSFITPVYYSPTLQVFTIMAIASFYGSFFLLLKSNNIINFVRFSFVAGILAVFYILYFLNHSLTHSLGMFIITAMTGTFGYVYLVYSSKLSQTGFSASEILAVRFWLLLLVSLFFVLKDHQYVYINLKTISDTLLVGVTSLIVPIYCAQKSIEKIGPELHGILIGLSPFATFMFEKLAMKNEYNTYGYLSIALFSAIALPYFAKMIKQKWVKSF